MPSPPLRRLPDFRHIFTLREGGTLHVPARDAKRILDRRAQYAPTEVVWEVRTAGGVIRRLWPEDIVKWEQEPL